MKEDIVEDDAFDDDTDSFGGALYPEDDWLSDDAYSRNCTYSPRDSFSQADTLNDTESRNDIFTSQSSYSRDFDHEEQVAPPTPIPQIPIPQIPEKPLSLCAIDFAEAVSREYSLTGKTEFVDCALRVVKQLLGSRRANIETHHLYGQLFFAAGQWSEGCEQFEVVMELNPINALCTPVSYVQQYICDKCFIGRDEDGVSGRRYKCTSCRDYDLCSSCFPPADGDHITGHKFVQIPSDKWMRANGLVCFCLDTS
jgi:hypothetical protein